MPQRKIDSDQVELPLQWEPRRAPEELPEKLPERSSGYVWRTQASIDDYL